MTTEQMIEEALMRLRAKVKKLVKENVRYLVSDPDDIRVGILSQEQMEYWVVSLCKKELQTIATKSAEEIVEEIDGLIEESGGVYGLHMNGEPATWEWLINNGWLEKTGKLLAESKDTNEEN